MRKIFCYIIPALVIITMNCCEKNKSDSSNNSDHVFDLEIDRYKYYSNEIFPDQYRGIYDNWWLSGISGGLWGIGYEKDFEHLVVQEIGIFKIYRNDSLIVYGRINIEDPEGDDLLIGLWQEETFGEISFFDMQKYVDLNDSSLNLFAPCCDRFNYHFISCEEFTKDIYYQERPELDNIIVSEVASNENDIYQSLFFLNNELGYVLCNNNTVLKTINGGDSWSENSTHSDLPLNSLFFVNDSVGYIVGGQINSTTLTESAIYKTENGAVNWVRQTTPEDGELLSVHFTNDSTGYAVGGSLLLKTNNGGKNWYKFSVDFTGLIRKVFFLNNDIGFLCGNNNNLFRTNNGGETWINLTEQTPDKIRNYCNIYFIDENIGFLGDEKNILVKTTNGGATFKEIPNSPVAIFNIHFFTENYGVVFGSKTYSNGNCKVWISRLQITEDGGNTWKGDNKIEGYVRSANFCTVNTCYAIVNDFRLNNDQKIVRIDFQ